MSNIGDRTNTMMSLEDSCYKTEDYLGLLTALEEMETRKGELALPTTTNTENNGRINEKWREVISEWANNVADHIDCPRETVAICMNFVDRCVYSYLLEDKYMSKRYYQLLSLTCLHLAVKTHSPGSMSMETAIAVGRGCFTQRQIEATERDVLQRLKWRLHPPTSQGFLGNYMQSLRKSPAVDYEQCIQVYEHANYLLEVSVMDYYFVKHKPSEVALAALFNAIEDKNISLTYQQYHDLMALKQRSGNQTIENCQAYLDFLYQCLEGEEEEGGEEETGEEEAIVRTDIARASSPVSVMEDHAL